MVWLARYVHVLFRLAQALTLLSLIALLNISSSPALAHTLPVLPSQDRADARAPLRATITWIGAADSRWSNAANWDGGIVPGPLDVVHLTGTTDTEIDAAFSNAVAGLVLSPDFGGTVRLARALHVRGDVVIEGGTLAQGNHALTSVGWTQTGGKFIGGDAPLTIAEAASVRGGELSTPSDVMRVRSLDLQPPGVVRLGENGKLELTGDGTPLTGDGLLDTATNLPNSVESTGHATTDLLTAGPLRGYMSTALAIPAAAPANTLTLATGEDNLRAAVIDANGAFAYFGTSTKPGIVVKVRLSDFTRVGALKFAPGENQIYTAVMDAAHGFAYFGTGDSPGIVVQVRLADFTRVRGLKLNAGENDLHAAVIDSADGYAYFGTFTSPGKIIQVRLSDLTRVRALTLNAGENLLFPAVIDPSAGSAYFGGRTVPAFVVKIRLSDFTRVAKLAMSPGEDSFHTGVIDPDGGYAYFGSYTPTGIVVKVRLSDFTKAGSLTLNSGEGNLRSSVLDRTHGVIYFGTASLPGMVVMVRLSDFSRLGAQTLDPGLDQVRSAIIDPANQFVYFGTADSPGVVLKLPTSGETPGGSVTFNPTADAYVDAANPSTNYGSATQLRAGTSPVTRSYLHFNVSGLTGGVTRAMLRLYTSGSRGASYTVQRVADNGWSESAITSNNAPAIGTALGTSGTGNDAAWTAVDVTPYVTGNGTYSFALTGGDAAGLSFASRESANQPQLVIATDSGVATPPPTDTPVPATPTNAPTVTSTPAGGGDSLILNPVADAFVNANDPTANNGTRLDLKVDGKPEKRAYLRFNVSGLAAAVTKATLRVYANTGLTAGVSAKPVADNTWGETTITFNNAPAVGSVLASSGAIAAGTWVSLDVTSAVTGNGTYSLALTSTNTTEPSLSLASRESTNKPQLVITTGPGGESTASPTPTLSASTNTPTPTPTAGSSATPTSTNTPTATSTTPANTPTRTPTRTATSASTPGTFTFTPVADAYVDSANPSTNYGTSTQIRIDGSPVVNSYLRFNVTGLTGSIAAASLRLYANSSASTGGQVRGVASNAWSETTITFSSAPAPSGTVTGTIGAFTAGAWSSVNVTPLITGNGTYSIAVTTTGSTAVSLGSRESGSHAPQLIITTK